MAKKMDFKQFLIEKGERLGLGVALVLMIALFGLSLSTGLEKQSPTSTAQEVRDKSATIQSTIISAGAAPIPALPRVLDTTTITGEPVQFVSFKTDNPFFSDVGIDVGKRQNPSVMSPVEFKAALIRAQVRSLIVLPQRESVKLGVLISKDGGKAAAKEDPRAKAQMDFLKARFGGNIPAQVQKALPNLFPGGPGGVGAPEGPVATEYRLDYFEPGKMPAGAKPAETVQAYRMVIVSACFPYRQQLEVYKSALRAQSLNELEKNKELPTFHRFEVRRRTSEGGTKAEKEWKTLNLDTDYRPVLQFAIGTEPESAEFKNVIVPGLVQARPLLARGAYPDPDLPLLNKIARAMLEQTTKNPSAKVLKPEERRFTPEGVDILTGMPVAEEKKPEPTEKPAGGPPPEPLVPDFCLVRFIDVTAQPGKSYEYQIQIKVLNPNFGKKPAEVAYESLTRDKELTSGWAPEKPVEIKLPLEHYAYATELDDKALKIKSNQDKTLIGDSARDMTFMQMHRWLETVRLNPEQRNSDVPVGDWAIADVPVRRGEYVGRVENVEVSMWFPTRERFAVGQAVAAPIKSAPLGIARQAPRGIPVNFATDDILVDWEGGKVSQTFKNPVAGKVSTDIKEEGNIELLILAPDGKLKVRNSRADRKDPDREARHADYDKAIKEAKEDKPTGNRPTDKMFEKPK